MAGLRISTKGLQGVLGLQLEIEGIVFDPYHGLLDISFKDADFGDQEVVAEVTWREYEGERWYKTSLRVPGYTLTS